MSFHTDRKTGDMHMHFAVSRIARAQNGRFFAIDPGLYKNKLKHLSRDCERDYGLRELSNERPTGDLARASDRKEFEESRRLGTDIRAIRAGILGIASSNARLFIDREPKGGYGGYIAEILLVPRGVKPSAKLVQPEPDRPEAPAESNDSNTDDWDSPHRGDAARALTARR